MDVDLNADLGEGSPYDAELLNVVTTANVCCGLHAGDAPTAYATLCKAGRQGVCAGAHPGFADREHFGRRELSRREEDVLADCVFQVGALEAIARLAHVRLTHVKAHGALYNLACRNDAYARPVVEVAARFGLPLFGLPGSRLETLSAGRCGFVREGFADRRYRPDGSLVPRDQPDALVHDAAEAVAQVHWLLRERGVRTICIHGDNPEALTFARAIRTALATAGCQVAPFTPFLPGR